MANSRESLLQEFADCAAAHVTKETPKFGNDREKVTREAADRLAVCFRKLIARKVDRGLAQRFILQSLVALFAEDIGLLPRYLFASLVAECKEPADSYDKLGGLFEAMNSPTGSPRDRYKNVRYFNSGIFAEPSRLELYEDELSQLGGERGTMKGAASSDWSKVSPEIFGAIFQDSMDAGERHAFGAHYTSPVDIMKIVKPTISDPWKQAIEGAKSAKKLNDLLDRLTTLRVLDPACGTGNFLYLAYRVMKRLETRIRERLTTEFPREQPALIHVNARQFFGIDINPFAVELAKVTLMVGRKLAIDELHIADEKDLPLDNLDANFLIGDALLTAVPPSDGNANGNAYAHSIRTKWPPAEIIIGNPPFLGAKRLKPERGPEYVNALRKFYHEVPGMADYCVYWFRRAHDHLPTLTAEEPLTGRAGLVGTQNIRNNESRVGGLDHIVNSGSIIDAVDNQPWSGDAHVHVSIVNWVKTTDARLLPKQKSLWTLLDKRQTRSTRPTDGKPEVRMPDPVEVLVDVIPPTLSTGVDVSSRFVLDCNREPQRTFQGKVLGYPGFLLTGDERARMSSDSADVVFPIVTGRELLDELRISRWVIDFRDLSLAEAQKRKWAYDHCRQSVLPEVQAKVSEAELARSDMLEARREHLNRWWQFWNRRDELNEFIGANHRFIACSRVTRRPVFHFVASSVCPSDALQVFGFADDYSFGILQSVIHFEWFKTSSRLKVESDLRYSSRAIFDTFPWPQSPTDEQVFAVAEASRHLRKVRSELTLTHGGGLRDLYRLIEVPGRHPLKDAHARLDAAVCAAYGTMTEETAVLALLELNRQLHHAESAKQSVRGPGLPTHLKCNEFVKSSDCLFLSPFG